MSGTSSKIDPIQGTFQVSSSSRFAIVASRFNAMIVERLIEGALDGLARHGVGSERIQVVRVPGSWELPQVCARLAKSEKLDAVIALGAVIRGATSHFEHVAGQALKGLADVALQTGIPVALGVLTTDTLEQALERAGAKAGNKGFDAALAALEMVSLDKALSDAGY